MKHPTLTVLTAFIVILLASSAFASIAFIPSTKQANLSRNDSIGLQFQLKNLGFEEACIDIETQQDDRYIDTHLSQDHVCLNGSESTNITVTIRTENAQRGLNLVALEADSSQGNAYAFVSIYVSEEPEIELVAYPNDICRGGQEEINVLVRNNSDEFKEVTLQAENEMLLPYFERSEISLIPFDEKYVELRVHPSPYSSEGRHYISMYAITEDETVKERLALDVVECGAEEKAEFSVRISSGCFNVEKGEKEKIYFTVENRAEEEQKLYFSIGNELNARLGAYSAWLEEGEEREFYFEVFAEEETRVKDYELKLKVWNSEYGVEKEVCIRPEKMHSVSVQVEENNLEIKRCESAVFTITLENKGDYYEDIELNLDNDYDSIEAVLSEDDFRLEKHETKQVYVSVNVLESTALGNYSIWLEIEANGDDLEKQLKFEVIEKEEPEEIIQGLKIVSHASIIRMDENSEKKLLVSVKNNGLEQLDGITIQVIGLPAGISSTLESNVSLVPGQVKGFELTATAGESTAGEYNPILQVSSQEQSDEKAFSLIVEAVEEKEETVLAGLTGLFTAAGSALLGLAALAIIVIAIVLASRAMKNPSTENNTKKELWLRG